MGDGADMALDRAFNELEEYDAWEADGADLADGYERGIIDEDGGTVGFRGTGVRTGRFKAYTPSEVASFSKPKNWWEGVLWVDKAPARRVPYLCNVADFVKATEKAILFSVPGFSVGADDRAYLELWFPKVVLTRFTDQVYVDAKFLDSVKWKIKNEEYHRNHAPRWDIDASDKGEECDLGQLKGAGQKPRKAKANWSPDADDFGGF